MKGDIPLWGSPAERWLPRNGAPDGWAEAIGQSSYYSLQTDKKPGIVLIMESMQDRKYWLRLNSTIQRFNMPIETWSVGNAAY